MVFFRHYNQNSLTPHDPRCGCTTQIYHLLMNIKRVLTRDSPPTGLTGHKGDMDHLLQYIAPAYSIQMVCHENILALCDIVLLRKIILIFNIGLVERWQTTVV